MLLRPFLNNATSCASYVFGAARSAPRNEGKRGRGRSPAAPPLTQR
jgi:hypothetical protein